MSSSYVVPPQQGSKSEQVDAAELASTQDQNIKTHTAIAAWDSYAAPPFMSPSVNPQGTNGDQSSLANDSTSKPLPKIGETRCCKSLFRFVDFADHYDRWWAG